MPAALYTGEPQLNPPYHRPALSNITGGETLVLGRETRSGYVSDGARQLTNARPGPPIASAPGNKAARVWQGPRPLGKKDYSDYYLIIHCWKET